MSLMQINKGYFDKGVFLFENGKYIYIEEILYSGNGIVWESEFEPLAHPNPNNLSEILPGHKWRQVRHAGDEYPQKPMKIIPEDGRTPMFKVEDRKLYQKYIDEPDTKYVQLFDLEELRGTKGDTGDKGEGLKIDAAGYLNHRPNCNTKHEHTQPTCNSCNPNARPVVTTCSGIGSTFLTLGKSDGTDSIEGVLSVDDIVLYSPVVGEKTLSYAGKTVVFTEINPQDLPNGIIYIGEEVRSRGSITISNTGAIGNTFTVTVDGNPIAIYTTTGLETVSNIAATLAISLGAGYRGITFGASSFYVDAPIGAGESGDNRVLALVVTGTAAGSVVALGNVTAGVNRGAHTVDEQVNAILAVPSPIDYHEEGIGSGIKLTRRLTSGTIDGNLTVGNTGIDLRHNIIARGIEAIVAVVDTRYPGEAAGVGQTGEGVRGNVYVCTKAGWILMTNIAAPVYKMAPTEDYAITKFNGLYMEDYVDLEVPAGDGSTIYMDEITYKLGVKINSIEPAHLKDGSFGDGLEEGVVGGTGYKEDPIIVKVSDFDGVGLKAYTSITDLYDDLQVDVEPLLSDGLIHTDKGRNGLVPLTTDGEMVKFATVKVTDLITPTTAIQTGLINSLNHPLGVIHETDTFENIYVKPGDAIEVDIKGVNVKSDELTLTSLDSPIIKVMETDSLTLGVQAKHIHSNMANETKGLEKENDTTGQFYVKIDTTDVVINPLMYNNLGEVTLTIHGVQGKHLHRNIADEDNGALFMDETLDKLQVKVVPLGGLRIINEGLEIDKSDLTWLDDFVVKKVELQPYKGWVGGLGETNLGDLTGDIGIRGDVNSDIYMNILIKRDGQFIEVVPETNIAALQALIDLKINAYDSLVHSIPDINGLQAALDSKLDDSQAGVSIATLGIDGKLTPSQRWDLAAHTHVIADVTSLQIELDKRVESCTWYDNILIRAVENSTGGLYIRSADDATKMFKLHVDNNGNLFTTDTDPNCG